ncbi:hypothetical protein COHA_006645 [Chlorella ohadii]|uniref:Endoglucanase n=1 Tax=Chlorella ohadii TaxID=2649997 RepID=A0AAD5H0M6_9CHLO|nr:hypothetical protein COHA_006645 [Chlorella ohadii]
MSPAGPQSRRPGGRALLLPLLFLLLASPQAARAAPTFGPTQYKQALGLNFLFYEAQRSGNLPETASTGKRVTWRNDSHLSDPVVGGWYDAGDHVKHSYTIALSTLYISWAALDFASGLEAAGQLGYAKQAAKWGATYLAACHLPATKSLPERFVGLIGEPNEDHNYWGRPEEDHVGVSRTAYTWHRGKHAASDMLGMVRTLRRAVVCFVEALQHVSAALASASMLLKKDSPALASSWLSHAQQLHTWATEKPGLFCDSLPSYQPVKQAGLVPSSRYLDKLMLSSAWMYRATGNAMHLQRAYSYWKAESYHHHMLDFDSQTPAAAAALLHIARFTAGASNLPGKAEYESWLTSQVLLPWAWANGTNSIIRTVKGMHRHQYYSWGNLRQTANVAFIALLRAAQLPATSQHRKQLVTFAKSQIDYCLGKSGRSFVVGFGTSPPVRPHHRAASCKTTPDAQGRRVPCGWEAFWSTAPNPQVLRGALVGGPGGLGAQATSDTVYQDSRQDYAQNEVALDYNAGYQGALAGLLALQVPTS